MAFIESIKQQIKFEIDLCLRDQLNLNQGLQGIIDYENQQGALVDSHFQTILNQINREKQKLKEELKSKIALMKDR